MLSPEIIFQRIFQQGLESPAAAKPADVVHWLGAVQAQDYPGAKWSLGMRLPETSDRQVEQALDAGEILRTHLMRPTWHFVTPADIRWLVELTAPHVKAQITSGYRRNELDEPLLERCKAIFARALRGGQFLTRAELAAELAKAGIAAEGNRLAHIAMHAELDALICSGPRRGKQFTYALLEERAPQARRLERGEAVAELVRRYFTGHGPATLHDFAWWSGLRLKEVQTGLEQAAAHLDRTEINGKVFWFAREAAPAPRPEQRAYLLPTYDELMVGYAAFGKNSRAAEAVNAFNATMVWQGQVIGRWRRILKKERVVVEVSPYGSLDERAAAAIQQAAERYGRFIDLPAEIG